MDFIRLAACPARSKLAHPFRPIRPPNAAKGSRRVGKGGKWRDELSTQEKGSSLGLGSIRYRQNLLQDLTRLDPKRIGPREGCSWITARADSGLRRRGRWRREVVGLKSDRKVYVYPLQTKIGERSLKLAESDDAVLGEGDGAFVNGVNA